MIYLERAKNGSYTCRINGRYLHSRYNPRQEAEKFVDSIRCDFTPLCIIVLGPCLSYCLPALRKRFSDIPLYAVQYNRFFISGTQSSDAALQLACADEKWDGVFLCENAAGDIQKAGADLSEKLFFTLGEQEVFGALFIAWTPAQQIFENESRCAWAAIKLLLQKNKDVLATRGFFARRWLKNSVRFFTFLQNPYQILPGTKPVLVAASGPSLHSSLPFIQKHRNAFFVIAVSSALTVLIHKGIYPDLCITTDGGFYADYHIRILKILYKKGISVPLAASAESKINTDLLEHLPIVPLRYGDGIENLLFDYCGVKGWNGIRNGSVSGTAAYAALSITSAYVFFCGLDLEGATGYPHTQPNALEQTDCCFDNRLRPLATRLSKSAYISLDIYRRWFSTQDSDFARRIFRISKTPYSAPLGFITDISWADFEAANEKNPNAYPPKLQALDKQNVFENRKKVFAFLTKQKQHIKENAAYNPKTKEPYSAELHLWYENCAPLEYFLSLKYPESEKFKAQCTAAVLNTLDELFKLCV
ncbi:DUF115 domain-containing protein [Treponema sp. OMZ 840]|uniref:6-hydroxymethylpterin diphosphokinase MptE-like protein n=1 Tax=Treponema sp. OMZ 840 TaxID=244313 RepID=UPI003D8BABD5